jgi:hypothetical protein
MSFSMDDVTHLLEKAGLKCLESKELKPNVLSYVHDDLCPKFIKYHPTQRSDLAQSTLVRRNYIVLQVLVDTGTISLQFYKGSLLSILSCDWVTRDEV